VQKRKTKSEKRIEFAASRRARDVPRSAKLLDAGTSIGANIEEGRAGQTKPDFIAKNFISLKESLTTSLKGRFSV